jgi:hypothetical protein
LRIQPLSPCPSQISPHLIITWRPDLGLYTAHLQQPAPDNATVITGARATLLPAIQPPADALFGPALRLWQGDPWNNKPLTFALEKGICLINYVYSAAATWASVVVKGNTTRYLLEGVVPTNDITSVDCKQECTFANPAVDSTTEVGDQARFLKTATATWEPGLPQLLHGAAGLRVD